MKKPSLMTVLNGDDFKKKTRETNWEKYPISKLNASRENSFSKEDATKNEEAFSNDCT